MPLINAEAIKTALRCGRSGCSCARGANVHCPVHDDQKASFTVHASTDGKVLLNCKAGCSQQAIVEALKNKGLWGQPELRTPDPNGRKPIPEGSDLVAMYEYRDALGIVVAVKGRFESPDGNKEFKWKLPGASAWTLEGKKISEIPLWGVELLAGNNQRIFFVEGEKAALACRKQGLLAVTFGGGASSHDFGTSLESLRGRDVVLWPDNDDPGRKYMDSVRARLRPLARSIVTIFPPVPEKGDAFEFFTGGNTGDALLAIVPTAPRPVLEFLSSEDEGCIFQRCGLGYQAQFTTSHVRLTIDQLRRSAGDLRGELLVESDIPTIPRHLSWGTLILSSPANREKMAKVLEGRTQGMGIDWNGIIEVVCRKVALSERQGEPFTTAGDMAADYQLVDWAISGFAPRLEPTTVWGDGGVGKSSLVLGLGIGVKAGVEIVPGFAPLVKGNILYLDWEASRQRLDSRIKRICAGAGIQPVVIGYRRCQVPLVYQIEDILRYCQSEGVVLVIVDSVEMAMSGTGGDNSNPNDKVILLHSGLRLLNTTTILIDHVNAIGRTSEKLAGKPGGGVSKTNLARMAFELRKGKNTIKPGHMSLGLFNIKRNDDGPPLEPIGIKVRFEAGLTWFEREAVKDVSLISGLTHKAAMEMTLKEHGPLKIKDLAELSGVNRAIVDAELSRGKETFDKQLDGTVRLIVIPEPPKIDQEELPF